MCTRAPSASASTRSAAADAVSRTTSALARRAVHLADAREQQAQVVADLGDRPHRRARVAHAVALLDGDRRRHAGDAVDVGPLHALEELPRIGRHRLDVAPLPFGIQRVERQRRLARSAHAGHHRQRRARDLDAHVLEVVRARAVDVDRRRSLHSVSMPVLLRRREDRLGQLLLLLADAHDHPRRRQHRLAQEQVVVLDVVLLLGRRALRLLRRRAGDETDLLVGLQDEARDRACRADAAARSRAAPRSRRPSAPSTTFGPVFSRSSHSSFSCSGRLRLVQLAEHQRHH